MTMVEIGISLLLFLVASLFMARSAISFCKKRAGCKKRAEVKVATPSTVTIERHPIVIREFFSRAEYRLWHCLRQVVRYQSNTDLLSKVRWEDVWQAKRGPMHMKYRGFLRSRHVDYALYDRTKNRILLLIELNDRSHQQPDRKERDERLKEFCLETGMPLLILYPSKYFDQDYIRQRIEKAINGGLQ